ncbi:MAG: response regulator, partial [Gammaproteobacteria bacterium]|nr:response regulator [Gammaproteobacteria bacterium]
MKTNNIEGDNLAHLYKRIPKLKGDLHRSFLIQIKAISQIWRRLLYFSWEQTVFVNWAERLHQLSDKYSNLDPDEFGVSLVSVARLADNSLEKNIPLTDKQRREISALLDSLEKNISSGIEADTEDRLHHKEEKQNHTIVIIDDEPVIIDFLKLHLEHSGYTVKGFQLPDEALEYIGKFPPSAIIVDIMFPGDEAGGIQVVKNIRKLPNTKIPVLFLSAREDFEIRMQSVKAGGNAFITKPVDVPRLQDKLQELVDEHAHHDRRVLMIMPYSDLRQRISGLLAHDGISVHFIDKPQETIAELIEYQPDLVIISEFIDHFEGIQIAKMIHQQDAFSGLPMLFIADEVTQEMKEVIYKLDADIIDTSCEDNVAISFIESRISQYRKHISYSEYSATQSMSRNIMTRSEFMYELSLGIELSGKRKNGSALLFVEINNLNYIRQRYGMDCGDLITQDVANIITEIAKGRGIVSRYSDTVFSVLTSGSVRTNEVRLGEAIYNKLRSYRSNLNNEAVSLDTVVGGMVLGRQFKNVNQVIQEILNVCEVAHGKITDKIHFSTMNHIDDSDRPEDKQCLRDIKYALANEGFKLVYQPIMDMRKEGKDKYELLLRLFDKEGQIISPASFFPVAMKNDLQGAIDRWVIEHALKSLSLIPKGMEHPLLFMKISNASLVDDSLQRWLGERIHNYGLQQSPLVFELDE